MWKKPLEHADVKREINTIAMEALTAHIHVENFKGTKGDEEFAYVKRKLIHQLELLGNMKLSINDKVDLAAIEEIEMNIKRSIADLETKASDPPRKSFKSQHLVKTHSANRLFFDYEKSELFKAESVLQQVKKEVSNLETNLESNTNTENLHTLNNLEEKIVLVYKDLEQIENLESNELKKLKDDLYKDLFRCSGKLKKARRKSSVTPPDAQEEAKVDPKTFKEVQDIRSIDAQLKSVEDANRSSFEDLNTRINTLTRQISHSLSGEKNGSQVAAKIKVEALKLAWESVKQHLYSEHVSVDAMVEMIEDLDQLMKDLHLNNKQFKEYVRSHKGDWKSGENTSCEKMRLKGIVEHLQTVKRRIACYQGFYKDQEYVEIEKEMEQSLDMLRSVESGIDVKTDLAKAKIQNKIMEYLELLDEKSIKV